MSDVAAAHDEEDLRMDTHDGQFTRSDPLLVLQAEIGATGWYAMYVMTHSVGNEVTASIGRRERRNSQVGATDEVIDVGQRSACGHWERVESSVWRRVR